MPKPCPHCGFRIAAVAAADASRCPRCERPLQAAAGDDDTPATTAEAETIAEADPNAEATTPVDTAQPDPIDTLIGSAAATVDPGAGKAHPAAGARDAGPRPPRRRAPSFVRGAANAMPTGPRWPGVVAVAVLLLVLALQLLLAQRAELAANPQWRPLLSALCGPLPCEVPPWREPEAFTMLQRSVLPRAGTAGVLVADASFRNDARWPQPWPVLVLRLSDVDGRTVGQRAFAPAEYLGGMTTSNTLASGQSASAHLEIIEPAPDVVAFSFDFH